MMDYEVASRSGRGLVMVLILGVPGSLGGCDKSKA